MYRVSHSISFRNGEKTAPYYLTRTYKTVRGALRAGERHAYDMEDVYNEGSISCHHVQVWQNGQIVTSMAA